MHSPMSRQHQDDLDDDLPLLHAHYELLESAMRDQLGPVAGTLVRVLCITGPMTLRELAVAVKQEAFHNPLHSPDEAARVRSSISVPSPTATTGSNNNNNNNNDDDDAPIPHSSDVLSDAAIKEVIARLVLHRVVQTNTEHHTYSISLGYALFLRVLFPIVAQFFQRRYGEAGVTLLTVFYELAALPWDAAVRLAIERRPSLTDALRLCAREMERLGLISFISTNFTGGTTVSGGINASSHTTTTTTTTNAAAASSSSSLLLPTQHGVKRQREVMGSVTSPEPCRLCVTGILREMFHDAILHQLIAERFADGGVAAAIAKTFMHHSSSPSSSSSSAYASPPSHYSRSQQQQQQKQLKQQHGAEEEEETHAYNRSHHASEFSSGSDRPNGYPPSHARVSASLPLRAIRESVSAALSLSAAPLAPLHGAHNSPMMALDPTRGDDEPVSVAVHRMCRSDGDGILRSDGTIAQEGPFRFRYDAALKAMQWDCCERILFARHGVLGVRLMKLLLQHSHAEDRMLAEEAIATLPRTREALHAMMRDGFVRQQEVPRTGQLADRQPKHAVYLWTSAMSKDVRPTCRRLIAQALHVASSRLAGERRQQQQQQQQQQQHHQQRGQGLLGPTQTSLACAVGMASEGEKDRREGCAEGERWQRGVMALEGSVSALMHMMLVLEFY